MPTILASPLELVPTVAVALSLVGAVFSWLRFRRTVYDIHVTRIRYEVRSDEADAEAVKRQADLAARLLVNAERERVRDLGVSDSEIARLLSMESTLEEIEAGSDHGGD